MIASPSTKTFDGAIAFENSLHRLVKIQAHVRRRIQAARQQVLRHLRGAADIRLDHHVANDVILGGTVFFGQQIFVERAIDLRKLAGALRADQIDALHRAVSLW